jgi:glycosyltransferase involved in cell wall biosynthesis
MPEPDPKRILTVSRLVRFKACDVLIDAIGHLREEFPDISLTIAGDGPERSLLEAKVEEQRLRDRVKFLGYVTDTDTKAKLFHNHGLFVQAGRYDSVTGRAENFGIVFAEAAAFCRAAIGPRIGGVPEIIEEGVTGLLSEPDNASSMTQQIRMILEDPDRALAMGKLARLRVEEKFRYDRIATTIVSEMTH